MKKGKKKKSVLKAKKAVTAARETSPPVSTAASEFHGLEGRLGMIRAGPYSRGTLVIWSQKNPPTVHSLKGGHCVEKSLS